MLRENKFKTLVNTCTLPSKPLVELYDYLCNLEKPYLLYKYSDTRGRWTLERDEICYLDSLETQEGVTSYYKDVSGWELLDSWDDIVTIKMITNIDDKMRTLTFNIPHSRFNKDYKPTPEELLSGKGLRIPTEQELNDAKYVDGIPGYPRLKIKEIERFIHPIS